MTITTNRPTTRRVWRLNPVFVLRVAGLAFDTADELRSPALREASAALRDRQVRLGEAGESGAEVLFTAIGGEDRVDVRRALMAARRDLHNGRPASAPPGAPDPVRDSLASYADACSAHEQALTVVDRLVTTELDRTRGVLVRAAADVDLRLGMQLSSAEIDRHVDSYLGAAGGTRDKKSRRLETSLVEYLHRTACKTSPFGRLTTVVAGRLDDSGSEPLTMVGSPAGRKSSTARVSLVVLSRIAAAVLRSDELLPQVDVTVVEGAARPADATLTYWRRTIQRGESDGSVVLDNVVQSRFTIPVGDAAATVVRLLEARTLSMAALNEGVCHAHPAWSRDEVTEYLRVLLEVGVLRAPGLGLDVHAADPLISFRDAVGSLTGPHAVLLHDTLDRVRADVDAFPQAPLAQRRNVLAGLRAAVNGLLGGLGSDDLACPRTVVFEDSTISGARATGSRTWWGDVGQDLEKVAAMVPAFDLNGVRRAAMTGYFERRVGRGGRVTDVSAFIHDFEQDFYGNLEQRLVRHRRFDGETFHPVDNWFRQASIEAIDGARLDVRDRVRSAHQVGVGEIDLAQVLGDDFLDRVPDQDLPLTGWSFFAQVDLGSTPGDLIVNRIHAGAGLSSSRFLHLLPEAATGLRAELAGLGGDGLVLAELVGGVDTTNLNLHPSVLPYEIVCPGQDSSRPVEDRIALSELVVEHIPDEDRLRLWCERLAAEVVPVYQGLLVPMALPDTQRMLLNFSAPGPVMLDLWEGIPLPETEVTALPAVRWGRVVLHRRQWSVPAALFPAHQGPGQLTALVRAWQDLADDHGLPDRVFVRVPGQSKPCFVDRSSVRSIETVALLGRGATTSFVVTEMTPQPGDLWLTDEDGRQYVTELTLEINGRKSGRV